MLTRLEVNVATVKKNILFIKKEIKDKLKFEHITATLKGNAYGFGIEKIANLCLANGVDTIAVARMSEAIQLRQLVKGKYEIMLIGIVDNEDVALAIKHNAILPVTSIEHANEMAKLNIKNLKIQFKLNTGMNRIGFKNKEDLKAAYTLLTKKGVKVMGVYSHIYDNGDVEKSKKQFDLFEELASAIPNWKKLPYRHIRASGGVDAAIRKVIAKRDWENNVRPGCSIFGYESYDPKKTDAFNCMQLVSKVVQVSIVPKNETVGYESTYKVNDKFEYIANIPAGWADGLSRSFSGKSVYINGKLYPIVGKMAMDNLSVKVDKTVKKGDTVYIFKDIKHASTFIDDPSDLANIIAVIANLSVTRVPRVYVEKTKK